MSDIAGTVGPWHGDAAPVEPTALRRLFGQVPSGLVAVAAIVDHEPIGLTASTFIPVSLDPPLVAFCVQHSSKTWPRLRDVPRLGISVLAAHHHDAARRLAGPAESRFVGLPWTATAAGAVLLDDAGAQLDCGLETLHPAGDHDIVVLRVHAAAIGPADAPLVFHGSTFHTLRSAS